ncbi:hypothetical protein ACFPOD_04705 [Nitratireductor kimnyeongensis]|uniref:DUF7507 domain-containing protein n=1 Tax=Nitratireductor kimnyeongensis TaxID=430679 RepID=A0ABW0T4V2_9HYPH|nr:DUF11 domain-containing protein [Nitratireductor kimnyeongensis]QZZ34613.1 hypothetical protein KW403_12490 [Nitratireductor kimnyeongensis]
MDNLHQGHFRRRVKGVFVSSVKRRNNSSGRADMPCRLPSLAATMMRRGAVAAFGLAVLGFAGVGTAHAQVQRSFLNLGFESPVLGCSVVKLPDVSVSGWSTTHSNAPGNCGYGSGRLIELWRSGFNGVPSRSGSQHAELNANHGSRLYQTVCLLEGDKIDWQFSHRGLSGTDAMDFSIGGTSRVVRATTSNSGIGGESLCGSGSTVGDATCSSTQTGTWRDYTGSFIWMGPTSLQQFGFESVSSSGGSAESGNHLDDIQLRIDPLVEFSQAETTYPESGEEVGLPKISVSGYLEAPLTVTVNVVGGTADLGDDYTTPGGGETFTVSIPAGTYTAMDFDLGVSIIEDEETEEDETIEFELVGGDSFVMRSTQVCGGEPNARNTHTIQEEKIELTNVATLIDSNGNGVPDAGEMVTYQFEVTNTSSVELSGITVEAPLPGIPVSGGPINLPAGGIDNTSFSASYTLTQADVDAGILENQAVVKGTTTATGHEVEDLSDDPDNAADEDLEGDGDPDDITILRLAAAGANTLEKEAVLIDSNGNGLPDIGETLEYTFTVVNTGNVTLTNIEVTDEKVDVKNSPIASLAPGNSDSSVKGTYEVKQEDIDAGEVANSATSRASDPHGDPVDAESSPPGGTPGEMTKTPLDQNSDMDLQKDAEHQDADNDGVIDVGETILYTFTVKNTGNVTLTDVTVEDEKVDVEGGPLASLEPGGEDAETFKSSYVVTQEDADAGTIENVAEGKAKDPKGEDVVVQSHPPGGTPGTATDFDIPSVPGLSLTKSASFDPADDTNGNGFPDAGEIVRYVFDIKNTGNVTLSNITVEDPNAETGTIPISSLASGENDAETISGKHVLTQEEVNAGEVVNQATARGETPQGTPVSDLSDDPEDPTDQDADGDDDPDDPTVLKLPQNLSLATEKTGTFRGTQDGFAQPGDTIDYEVTVTNDGTVTASDVTPHDAGPKFNGKPGTGSLSPFTPASAELDPAESQTFKATYTLSEADIANAQNVEHGVQNSATATGKGPKGDETTSPEAIGKVNLPGYLISKTAQIFEVQRGGRVPYVIRAKLIGFTSPQVVDIVDEIPIAFAYVSGSAMLGDTALTPKIDGRKHTFEDITLNPDEDVEIALDLRATAAAKPGGYINRAWMEDETGERVSGIATAEVEIVPEPVFDCGDILGKVFDDKNRNGYQDAGEPGLPGARVAAVKGLLVTSDDHGRFHVACADLPDQTIGTNYILKLDPRSLPSGYRITTENPRVVRLTAGKASEFLFGASIGRVVRLDLSADAFEADGKQLKPEWFSRVGQLITLLDEEPSVLRISYEGDQNRLARQRLAAVRGLISSEWRNIGSRYRLEIETRHLSPQKK